LAVLPPIPPGFLRAANCLKGCVRTSAKGKGLFVPYDEPVLYPWVEAWIPGENFRLSMGNTSSRENEAQIKSFNFGISNGLGVKIEVVDEAGGQFYKFFQRINYTNRAAADKMIRFRWGYIGQTTQGEIRNFKSRSTETPAGGGCGAAGGAGLPLPDPSDPRMVSNEHTLFIQDIECQASSASCFKFIINALDMHANAMGAVDNRTFGGEKDPIFLTVAIKELFKPYNIDVDFLEIDSTGNRRPLRFFVPPNTCPTEAQQRKVEFCGPCGRWNVGNRPPLEAACAWMNETFSKDGRGIIRFWEDIPKGQKLVFARSTRDPINSFDEQRVLGTYIVNGAACSPVISFQPNYKFMYQQSMTGAVRPPGNAEMPNKNVGQKQAGLDPDKAPPSAMTNLTNAGISMMPNTGQRTWIWFLQDAAKYVLDAATHNNYANMVFTPIEAELKIQGNPAYEWPYMCNGYALSVVYLNPFRPKQTFFGEFGDAEWFQGNPSKFGLSTDQCNPILTNCNWLIMGVSHDIRDGAYYTTIKVRLLTPGVDLPPNAPLGGCPGSFKFGP